MRIIGLAAALLALSACGAPPRPPVPAPPQACVLPREVAPPPLETVDPDEIVRDTPVAYHVLALTWSPEWCRTRGDAAARRLQCVDNRFGWVLHGLWPNGAPGRPHPRYCRPATPVPVATIRRHLCQTPSPELIQHEWAAHGVCGWEDPETYFTQAADLWQGLARPDPSALAGPSGRLTAGALRAAFAAANPGLPREAVAVALTDDNRLREVRLCHDLSMTPRACPPGTLGPADETAMTVEAVGPAR